MGKLIDVEESKKIQLDILQKVHDFCVSHNINYSLGYGTLLGAVRHKGFIPWDDDIDIIMYRKDYNSFIRLFHDDSGIIKVHSLENDRTYCRPYAKIEDSRTILEEYSSTSNTGIAIDLFPYDNVGSSIEEGQSFINKINIIKLLYRAKIIKPSKRNSVFKRVLICILKVALFFISLRKMAEIVSNRSQIKVENKFIADVVACDGTAGIIPSVFLEKVELIPFENRLFYAMENYDYYLSSVYGNYMQLPPKEKRQSPHIIKKIFWK